MKTAKEVMTKVVITVSPETTIEQVVGILLENNISGAPVVDAGQKMVGVISEFQLLELIFSPDLRSSPVCQFMTTDVIHVRPETPLTDIASQFVLHRIRRLPVVDDGRVLGVISRRDLLRQVTGANMADNTLAVEMQACMTR